MRLIIFRALYQVYRLLSWVQHRTPRRLTRAGLAVFTGLLLASVTGLDTDNMVVYQAFTLLLFLLLGSLPFLFFFNARFSAARWLPRFATAGSPLPLPGFGDESRVEAPGWFDLVGKPG